MRDPYENDTLTATIDKLFTHDEAARIGRALMRNETALMTELTPADNGELWKLRITISSLRK